MSVTAADLMAAPITPVPFVIDQLVPHGLTVLAAKPKAGKSFFVLQAALAVAQGVPFLGRDTDQGDVLYLALEDGERRLQWRLHQMGPAHSGLHRITFEFDAGKLGGGLEAALDAWHASADRPRLVVIDTYGRIDPGPKRGQPEYGHVTSVLGPLQQWALQHEVAIVIVHHLRKGGEGEMPAADVFERILGSQGMLGIADAALCILRVRLELTAELHVTSRDFEEAELALAIDAETRLWSVTTLRNDPLARFADRRRELLEALMLGPSRLKDIAQRLGITDSNANQHLNKAVRDGLVVKTSRGVYALEEHLEQQLVPPVVTREGEDTGIDEDAQDTASPI